MSEIEELQGRIAAAMDRIGAGIGALSATPEATDDGDLTQELEEERLANAQLEERLKKLKGEMVALKEATPAPVEADSAELDALRAEVELLRNEVGNPDEAAGLKAEVARLTAALDAAHDAPAETDPLEERISALTTENSVLHAEVTTLQDRLDTMDQTAAPAAAHAPQSDAEAELARQNDMLVKLDSELQRLRGANEELVTANEALRAASAQGLADPELINNAMVAEIEGLRAAQATDQAQINAVLARLEPLLEGAAAMPNMPEGEEQ